MSEFIFRIHPTIGVARMGSSEEFNLAPETPAGARIPGQRTTGGLPIRPGTEHEPISSADLRDADGGLKRQAARFRIFRYLAGEARRYPAGGGAEIRIGSVVAGKRVVDIVWTVHLANKKANGYAGSDGLDCYRGALPKPRNSHIGRDPRAPRRRSLLIIDPGPRTIRGANAGPVRCDRATPAAHGELGELPDYPKSFPGDRMPDLFAPRGPIDTLGELRTDGEGRLLVAGGHGRALAMRKDEGDIFPLERPAENDGWFDDTSDGPVTATLLFEDGSSAAVHGAWVVATDPSFAPQSRNVVTLWDDILDVWIRELGLRPEVYADGEFQSGYRPAFASEIQPIFIATGMQRWTSNLPKRAIWAHQKVAEIGPDDKPILTLLTGLLALRKPDSKLQRVIAAPLMPLSLGDQGQPFATLTRTQYFMLGQWEDDHFNVGEGLRFGPGELLDHASLSNCVGGRLNPGIDLPFVVRMPSLWIRDWVRTGAGPFRVRAAALDYSQARRDTPFLDRGYVPFHDEQRGLEPGDLLQFMAIPWHSDYNTCAIHRPDPNPLHTSTIYWAWPAQRPVAVHLADEVRGSELGEQRLFVRGPGTDTADPEHYSRFQDRVAFIVNWSKLGTVLQSTVIVGRGQHDPDSYLEVASLLDPLHDAAPAPAWKLRAKP